MINIAEDCFQDWCQESHRQGLKKSVSFPGNPPEGAGKGIVVVADEEYYPSLYILQKSLGRINCSLPVEVHQPSEKFPKHAAKIEAICNSKFNEILMVDADIYAFEDPSSLFDDSMFLEKGAAIWPTPYSLSVRYCRLFGTPPRLQYMTEGSIVLVDRKRHWPSLCGVRYLNENREYTYRHTMDDGITWGIGWEASGQEYHTAPQLKSGKIGDIRHDLNGKEMFVHRRWNKFKLEGSTVRDPSLPLDDLCFSWLEEIN